LSATWLAEETEAEETETEETEAEETDEVLTAEVVEEEETEATLAAKDGAELRRERDLELAGALE
jgi:hypothetical protein